MRRKPKDWVALIEAGYSLEGDEESWTKGVLDKAAPLFDRGWWPAMMTYRYTPTTFAVEQVATTGPSIIKKAMRRCETLSAEAVDVLYRRGNLVGSMSDLLFSPLSDHQSVHQRFTQGLVVDNLAVIAHTGEGKALTLGVGLLKRTSATELERQRWQLMASHLGAGLRLRNVAKSFTLDAAPIEAIFDSGR